MMNQDSADSNSAERLVKCLAIIAKNVPLSDELMERLVECELTPNSGGAGRSYFAAAGNSDRESARRRYQQAEQQQLLFASMATVQPAKLQQLANCLRIAGHPLMAELLLLTLSTCGGDDQEGDQNASLKSVEALLYGTNGLLPRSIAERLADSPEAQADLAELLSERRLLAWCRESLFDPAGADVMSLRKQHAEESWRAAREVREKAAAMAELQAKLSATEAALAERDDTIARLESRLSVLAGSASDTNALDELKQQLEIARRHQTASESQAQRAAARLESYAAAFDFVQAELRQFEVEAGSELLTNSADDPTSFVDQLRHELDDAHRLAVFQSDFGSKFLPACRAMLEENALLTARHRLLLKVLDESSGQQATSSGAAAAGAAGADTSDELVAAVESLRRQLAERDRRIASLTKTSNSNGSLSSPTPPPPPPRRSAAVAKAWDEVVPSSGQSGGNSADLKRYSVLPEIQSASSQQGGRTPAAAAAAGGGATGGVIPHSHRKATRRESNAKKREPPGKPLPANVVSLT